MCNYIIESFKKNFLAEYTVTSNRPPYHPIQAIDPLNSYILRQGYGGQGHDAQAYGGERYEGII